MTSLGFSPVSSTNKTDCDNITEILLKMALIHKFYQLEVNYCILFTGNVLSHLIELVNTFHSIFFHFVTSIVMLISHLSLYLNIT